jgi:hypothetical protein
MFVSTPENDGDVLALKALLAAAPIGGTVAYAEMTKAIGRAIEPRRYLLKRAADLLNAETGAVFENVRRVGYKRLEIGSVATIGANARRSIGRKAARASKRLARAASRANDVPQHVALDINRELSMLGLLKTAASTKVSVEVGKDMTPAAPMPIAKVAERLIAALS